MKLSQLLSLVTLTLVCARLSAATPVYSVIEVNTPGNLAEASGINDNGDIVGEFELPGPGNTVVLHAFVYHHASGSVVDLDAAADSQSDAFSINDSGTIIGEISGGQSKPQGPVAWLANGGVQPLAGPYPNGTGLAVTANGISNTGVIVGQGYINDVAGNRAVIYKNGTIANLGTLGGTWSIAGGIGSQGIYIAGTSELRGANPTTGRPAHAFLYRNGTRTDFGALPGGDYSTAMGVNNNGEVVGYSEIGQSGSCTPNRVNPPINHAFFTLNGKITDLGNLPNSTNCSSWARAINDTGEIVGWSDAIASFPGGIDQVERAFLYSGGQLLSLTFLDWGDPAWGFVKFYDAVGINCNGWIAANGYDTRNPNVFRVYLLIPKGPSRPQCPRPQ